MIHHRGRLFDHVHIVVADLEKSRSFYRTVLASIGRELNNDDVHDFGSDELFVTQVEKGGRVSHIHFAFQVHDRKSVDSFFSAAVAAGGIDNGGPGERKYHPGYYAAFVLDPDGNNIEAVYHGPADRSVESVEITPR